MINVATRLEAAQLKAAMPLVKAAFPQYTGRRVFVSVSDRAMSLNSYWEAGSRDYFTAVQLSTGKAIAVPQNGTVYDQLNVSYTPQPGIAIIEQSVCGEPLTKGRITIHLHPADAGSKAITAA